MSITINCSLDNNELDKEVQDIQNKVRSPRKVNASLIAKYARGHSSFLSNRSSSLSKDQLHSYNNKIKLKNPIDGV